MVRSRVVLVSILAGIAIGATGVALAPFATAAMQSGEPAGSDIALLAGVIQLVNRAYVHPIGSDELTKDALKGMLTRLDPHSDYMDEQEFKRSQADMAGSFGGLGMEISEQNELPKVVSPIDGTPAARAGLEPGDMIILINHASTQGVSLSQVVSQLRGDPGTNVTITILRGKQPPFDVTLTREIIKVNSVKSKLESDGIGYIRISQFGGDTSDGFKKAITDLNHDANGHIKGLVIDLRDDPGGLLSAAVDVSGDLLDDGPVVSIHGRQANNDKVFKAPAHGDMLPGTPVVVLINGASARDRCKRSSRYRDTARFVSRPRSTTRLRGARSRTKALRPTSSSKPPRTSRSRAAPCSGKARYAALSKIQVRSTNRPAPAPLNPRRRLTSSPCIRRPSRRTSLANPMTLNSRPYSIISLRWPTRGPDHIDLRERFAA